MDAYLIVDPDSRNITIPEIESAFGVYGDNNAERKYFKSPRIVGNGIDLTECYLYVNYISASTKIGQILCDVGDAPNGTATEDEIVFSWPITRNVLDKNISGEIFFAVQAKTKTGDTVFTTRKAKGNCYESIEGTEAVTEEYADIVLQLISRMDKVEENIGEQVAAYFKENPAVTSEYLTQTLKPIKDDLNKLNEGGLNLKDEVIAEDISNWLNKHPEATTTVLDESLTFSKFSKDTRAKSNNKYLNMVEFGCDSTGQTDVTNKIYTAVNKGYKNLYFPRGKYLFSAGNRFTLPIGGSVIGDMGLGYGTEETDEGNLTWFIVTQTNNPIRMQHDSELKSIAFYYPEQTEEFGIDYEPSITCISSAKSCVVDSCFFKNSKTAISFDIINGPVYITRNIGNPLYGIIIKNQVDLSYIMENHFGGTYNKDRTETTAKYINENGIAYQIGRADWSKVGSFCYGYKIGFYLIDSEDTLLNGCGADGCITGFILDGTSRVKMIGCTATGFSNRDDSNSLGECLVIRDTHKTKTRDYNQILGCSFFSSRKNAVNISGVSRIIIDGCAFADVCSYSGQVINLVDASNVTISNIIINNNEMTHEITNTALDGIHISANCMDIIVNGVQCDGTNMRYIVDAYEGATGYAIVYGYNTSQAHNRGTTYKMIV
jgi:hypothetical protein|nr:MAG TPA: Pectate lyase [Caudoviricetes sp.]